MDKGPLIAICDLCGKEIDKRKHRRVNFFFFSEDRPDPVEIKRYDLCQQCLRKLADLIDNKKI